MNLRLKRDNYDLMLYRVAITQEILMMDEHLHVCTVIIVIMQSEAVDKVRTVGGETIATHRLCLALAWTNK
jgi:hypothetical protein